MGVVLLVGFDPPGPGELADALRRHAGDRVGLVTLRRPPAGAPIPAGVDPDLVHALADSAEAHGPAVRRQLVGVGRGARMRIHLQHDSWVARHRDAGARMVPLDRPARRALRQLADAPSAEPAPDPLRARADELGARVNAALAVGEEPAELAAYLRAELAVADDHLARGETKDAAWSATEALRVAFHRVLHFDRTHSPLVGDPAAFLSTWHDSAVSRVVHAPREWRRHSGPSLPAVRRPVRVGVITRRNADFLPELLDHLRADPRYDLDFVDLAANAQVDAALRGPAPLLAELLAEFPSGDTIRAASEALKPHVEDRDVVFIEWWTGPATLISRLDTGSTRVVVRAHSYELFTAWPQLSDLDGIDDLVFVSPHLRDLAVAVVPGLRGPRAPRMHVVPPAVDLRRCLRPKSPGARFTLGVLGASKVVKDSRWAIEVLRILRRHDPRYRLVLVRGKLQSEHSRATRAYADGLARDLVELDEAVTVTGHTEDVPGTLQEIGVVLSSSVRESFHIALVEGAASGAVPVVRDWPYFPGGAAQLFPPEWVVPDPEAAATRILRLTADEDTWRAAGHEAAVHAIGELDQQATLRRFDELLLPEGR